MIFLYILLGIFALIALILFSCIRVKILFDGDLQFKIYLGIIKIPESLFNKDKEKEKKPKKDKKKEVKKAKIADKKKENKLFKDIKNKGFYNSFVIFTDFLKPVLKTLKSFASKIHINPLIIKIKMTGDDAAKLAVDYGKFCAVYYPALELLSYNTKCKNIDSDVFVNYIDEKTEFYIKTQIKIRLIHCVTHALKIIKEFFKLKSKLN